MTENSIIDKTPWCSAKEVRRHLERLILDIKSNQKDPEKREKKLKYLEELKNFVKLIDFSRGEDVKFRFSGNTEAMCKCMMEINTIFDENRIQVEKCSMVPKKCANKICVLKVDGQTLVLIELE